ncbi:transposase [Xenorhabdus vietnamensis]|uniref:Transposase n=1 Tax=Xenorhabdus vietnamensis TaxID=351656 RepID=A0A1Y2SAB1_9GAMM|nr:IS1-like element transposase [Xenorhabdus vietnamensis]OTA14857.1 transposase [Xenorhabdus vietnamensis]
MAKVDVYCRYCHKSEHVKGHGKRNGDHPRYRRYTCCKVFQLEYTYQACKPGVKEQIVDMAMNNGGIRDTARVLKIATATVMKTLNKSVGALENSLNGLDNATEAVNRLAIQDNYSANNAK